MKRLLCLLLALWLLTLPAFASGQVQTLLRATDEDGTVCSDTPLGSYAADAVRLAAGTDLALLPSDLLGLNLQPGNVTGETLALSILRDEPIYLITLTPADLKDILEIASSTLSLDEEESLDTKASHWGGFLQVSGIQVIYDVPAPAGERVYEAAWADDTELDLTDDETLLTAAVPASLLDGTYGYPVLSPQGEVGMLRAIILDRIAAEGVTQAPASRRIVLYGARQNEIVDFFPPELIVVVVLIFAFFGGHKWRRSVNFER